MAGTKLSKRTLMRTLVLQAMGADFDKELEASDIFGRWPFDRSEDMYVFEVPEESVRSVSRHLREGNLAGLYLAQWEGLPGQKPETIRGPQYDVIENARANALSIKVKLGVLPRELARVKNRPMKRRFDY